MNQLNTNKPCTTRDHVESIEQPGHCVWCGHPMHRDTMSSPAPAPCDHCTRPLGTNINCPTCRAFMPAELRYGPGGPAPARSAAIAELAACGSHLCELLDAVDHGATLTLSGADQHISAQLHNGDPLSSRTKYVTARGGSVVQVIADLLSAWRQYK